MARVNTSLTVACTPRRSRREMRDAVLTLAHFQSAGLEGRDAGLSPSDRDRTAARTCATPRPHDAASRGAATRRATESGRCPARLRPAGRARLLSCQTQYKCGQSGVRNNHPLGKTEYDWWLLLAPVHRFRGSKRLPAPAISNGVQMLVHSVTDGSTKTAARPAMARRRQQPLGTVGLTA